MYLPEHFAEPRVEVMHALIRENPLATLAFASAAGLTADASA